MKRNESPARGRKKRIERQGKWRGHGRGKRSDWLRRRRRDRKCCCSLGMQVTCSRRPMAVKMMKMKMMPTKKRSLKRKTLTPLQRPS